MLDSKVILPYKDDEKILRGEAVLAVKEGNYYRVKSIPLRASRIALYDLLHVVERESLFYFSKIIESSGRSVIQMIILKDRQLKTIGNDMDHFGCIWQQSKEKYLVAFDVPRHMDYQPIKDWLERGEIEKRWGYREACMSHYYDEK